MMKFMERLDKRMMVVLTSAGLAGIVYLAFINPLLAKVSRVSREAKILENELTGARSALEKASGINQNKRLLSRDQVSMAINEIINTGAANNINFLSTSPQRIEKPQGSAYPVLPIRMQVQSTYKNFGIFLGALEKLDKSVVTVRQFTIERKPEVLPKIQAELVVDVYLKEGQGG